MTERRGHRPPSKTISLRPRPYEPGHVCHCRQVQECDAEEEYSVINLYHRSPESCHVTVSIVLRLFKDKTLCSHEEVDGSDDQNRQNSYGLVRTAVTPNEGIRARQGPEVLTK